MTAPGTKVKNAAIRIGLFGGTFNPIHRGHLQIALEVLDRLSLDRVLLIPTGTPPHKGQEGIAPGHHRLAMVRLAIAPYERLDVSAVEVEREGPSYSVDTVSILRDAWRDQHGVEPELFFLMGTDAFREIQSWRDTDLLYRLCHIVVIARPGVSFSDLKPLPLLREVPPASLKSLDQGDTSLLETDLTDRTRLYLLRGTPQPISATDLRGRLEEGVDLKKLLPDAVEMYILAKRLYQGSASTGRGK